MTQAQRKALAALYTLQGTLALGRARAPWRNQRGWYARYDIGSVARGDCQGYPVKTMRALQRMGLVEPDHEILVEAVESGQCRCGCDRWRLTDEGVRAGSEMNIVQLNNEK